MTATMLQAELWMSFVSMLRSYAAAASLHAGEVAVRSDENDVAVEAAGAELAMRFDAETGVVSWTKRGAAGPAAAGRFEILADGVVLVNGTRRDLDHAAIDLVASVTEGTKGGRP
ncbi:MAG: hypothetical protein ACLGXA_06375 [Acidobacteriota bacterium]